MGLLLLLLLLRERGLRTRSCVPGFSAEVPKGGVEFINFPFAPFGSEI